MTSSRGNGSGGLLFVAVPFFLAGIYLAVTGATIALRISAPLLVFVFGLTSVTFIGVGLTLLAAWRAGRAPVSESSATIHPDEPWLWRDDWARGRIRDNSGTATAMAWGVTFMWNGLTSSILLVLPEKLARGDRFAWIGALFPLVGVLMLIAAARATLRLLRFRRSTLTLDAVPVPIGGVLRGSVEVPNPLSGASAVTLRLSCVTRVRSGKGSDDVIVCHEERDIDPAQIRPTTDGTAIPVEISVPGNAKPTIGNHSWQLAVDAELPGIDYSATFPVPVFAVERAGPRPRIAPAVVGPPRNPRAYFEREGPDGHELVFPAFHTRWLALLALACALFAIGASSFTVAIGAPRVMTVLFALVSIPLIVSAIDLFFRSRVVTLGPDRITVRTRLLVERRIQIPYGDVESVRARTAAQYRATTYYNVEIRTKAGKRVRVARYVRSKREADWIAARISRC